MRASAWNRRLAIELLLVLVILPGTAILREHLAPRNFDVKCVPIIFFIYPILKLGRRGLINTWKVARSVRIAGVLLTLAL